TAFREALRPAPLVTGFVRDLFRTHGELLTENLALRQQLIVAARKVKRPVLRPWERGLLVVLASRLRNWRNTILLVKPETVVRWHQESFRLLWKSRSRPKSPGTPRLATDTVELIRRMAVENRTWGAERIRGELLKLGIRVAKRTLQRPIRAVRPPRDGQRWRTFLRNHTVWACDFLQVYDIWFRPLFTFIVIDVNAKEVVHFPVTREPSKRWTTQQVRNATPFGTSPKFIIRDRDAKFSADFDRAVKGAGIRVLKTAVRAPWMNATCERFLGSVRRECLDYVIILGEGHLRAVLAEYVAYFNASRPHQGLGQRVPSPSTANCSSTGGRIVALPVLGGLHHDYRRAA
ncbi:integrase core domain-containing protein, partial [Myxococcota bacterium]